MLIWHGRGGLIALIAFGCLLLTELFTRAAFGDAHYYQTHGWPKLAGFWVAAGLVYALRSWFGVGRERILIDKDTGKEIKMSFEADLLFVPARYWPAILLALGILFFSLRTR
jgi:hypothetical protein